ncbi:MAG: hypothetical protein AB1696_06100 [Planctomycetota bacterium]
MRKGFLIGAIVVLSMGGACIAATVLEVATGKCGMGSASFWGGVAFHACAGIVASFLLVKARPPRQEDQDKADEKADKEVES